MRFVGYERMMRVCSSKTDLYLIDNKKGSNTCSVFLPQLDEVKISLIYRNTVFDNEKKEYFALYGL